MCMSAHTRVSVSSVLYHPPCPLYLSCLLYIGIHVPNIVCASVGESWPLRKKLDCAFSIADAHSLPDTRSRRITANNPGPIGASVEACSKQGTMLRLPETCGMLLLVLG